MDETLTVQPNVLDQNCESRAALDRIAERPHARDDARARGVLVRPVGIAHRR